MASQAIVMEAAAAAAAATATAMMRNVVNERQVLFLLYVNEYILALTHETARACMLTVCLFWCFKSFCKKFKFFY